MSNEQVMNNLRGFKLLCLKNRLIISVFIENASRRFVDGR